MKKFNDASIIKAKMDIIKVAQRYLLIIQLAILKVNKNEMKNKSIGINIIFTLLIFQLLTSCSVNQKIKNNAEDIEKILTQEKLAFELCAIYSIDQGVRHNKLKGKDINIGALLNNMDSISFDELVLFVNRNGYPNKKLLGDFYKNECVQSASGAVLLHNSHRIVTEKKYFDLFLDEVNKGNMPRGALLLILDRYYWAKSHGKKVLYGSQFGTPCIETKIKTNILRKEIGLKPLKDKDFKNCSKK